MVENNYEEMDEVTAEADAKAAEIQKKQDARKQLLQEARDTFGEGVMTLSQPIYIRGKLTDELKFDFNQLTAETYVDCMNIDRLQPSHMSISRKQALALFAEAVACVTDGADAKDIRTRLSAADGIGASEIATAFFIAQERAVVVNYSKKQSRQA